MGKETVINIDYKALFGFISIILGFGLTVYSAINYPLYMVLFSAVILISGMLIVTLRERARNK